MQRKIIVVGLGLLFAVLVIIKLANLINEKKKESDFIQKNWIEVTAKINHVTHSGRRNKQTTILQVEYMYNNDKQQTTIRKEGYIENAYKKGDSIKIFVNPKDTKDIR